MEVNGGSFSVLDVCNTLIQLLLMDTHCVSSVAIQVISLCIQVKTGKLVKHGMQ